MARLRSAFSIALACVALAACARPGVSLTVVQNGLEVQTTVHRATTYARQRIFTLAVRDADSKQPITDAEVAIAPAGAPTAMPASNLGNGSYELALDQPPGSSADINVAVMAKHRSLIFKLKRP